jgi:hypothetical protein
MTDLTLVVPTKGRPLNAARLIQAVNNTTTGPFEHLILAVDHDEPLTAEYRAAVPPDSEYETFQWATVVQVKASPQRIGPILNSLVPDLTADPNCSHIAFMGDDHLPRTEGWDAELVNALGGRPGVAYGNDLVQGENLPTAVVISSDIVRSLGYLVPPGLEHLYFDDFWKMLGQAAGNLVYREDVVIEHLHPTVGRADWDEGYRQANDPAQFAKDQAAYQEFLAHRWHDDLADLRLELNL